MDFEFHFSPEMEAFRKEVRDFLTQNAQIPAEFGEVPREAEDMSREMYRWGREVRRKMGERGWIFPTWPKEYGGGGLTAEHDLVIQQELQAWGLPDTGGVVRLCAPGLMVWASEEQKQRFLKPLLRGEIVNWQLWTEPEVGSDLAAVKTRAIRDGDYFVVNGTKQFISGVWGPPDYFWMLAVTDPDAPRHRNLGAFLYPANLPGITIEKQDLLIRGSQNIIYLDNVRVPQEYLIGGENQGWQVMSATAEVEHGAGGSLQDRDRLAPGLVDLAKGKKLPGGLGQKARESLLDIYLASNIRRLIGVRTYWQGYSGQHTSYEGSQNSLTGKQYTWKTGIKSLEVAGPYALLDDPEFGMLKGEVEHAQRNSMSTHAGGSPEIQKVIIARRIGLSRTKERQAATYTGGAARPTS